VALGVASVLAIQILNTSAVAAFEAGIETLSGEADLVVRGSAPTIPETLLPLVLSTPGVGAAWPVVSVPVFLPEYETTLRVLGLDLVTPLPGQPTATRNMELGIEEILNSPGWLLIDERLAKTRQLSPNQRVEASIGTEQTHLLIGAVTDFRQIHPHASSRTAVLDIAEAQRLTGLSGRLTQINVIAAEDSDSVERNLRSRLPASIRIERPQQQESSAAGLLRAFRLNLTALSLISLFVGLFLVYASSQAMLIRRRTEFGTLRSLGATRLEVFRYIAAEVMLLGLSGVLLGLPLGYWLAELNLHTVNSTLTSVYLLHEIEEVEISPYIFLLGIFIGLGGALLGAVIPALDVSTADPRALLSHIRFHEQTTTAARPLLWAGAGVLVLASVWVAAVGLSWKPSGFILGIALLISIPLFMPALVQSLSRKAQPHRFGFLFSLKSLADRLSTTSIAAAALAVAVSMLIGITLMVGSFRKTVELWINTSIVADVYVTTDSWEGPGSSALIRSSLIDQLETFPGVQSVDRLRSFTLDLGGLRVIVVGVEMSSPKSRNRYPLAQAGSDEVFEKFEKGEGVLVSEPLARKENLQPGATLQLPVSEGVASLPILGVTYDYSSDSGVVVMALERLTNLFPIEGANSLAVYAENSDDEGELAARLEANFQGVPLRFSSNQELRRGILRIFDQTFAVVRLLQVMSLLIAVCGVMLTLLILASERASEVALYRALGASRDQVLRIFLGKGASIALLGLLMGALVGCGLAWLLIFVVNRAYFGWTIQVYPPWNDLFLEVTLILLAALVASFYPAIKASQYPATELTRDDL